MPSYSQLSLSRLATCDEKLQRLFTEVIKRFDCTVLEGHRDETAQEAAFAAGKTRLHWPNGKHNALPSRAVDVIPFPIDWGDRERITYFAGMVVGIAVELGITIRWGGDWNSDTEVKDNSFDDLVHFELV